MHFANKLRVNYALNEALKRGFITATAVASFVALTTEALGTEKWVLVLSTWLTAMCSSACVIFAVTLEWVAPKKHSRLVTGAVIAGTITALVGIIIPFTGILRQVSQVIKI